jgi:CTP synthase
VKKSRERDYNPHLPRGNEGSADAGDLSFTGERGLAKYIFVTGGVVSSLGKGIAAASVGRILLGRGLRIAMLKYDPYINIDPGTMSPYQHGEVYVTEDGAETDLDLGHYERFTGIVTSQLSNVTSGKVYDAVIRKEREGKYLGATVQVVPHITNEIKMRIRMLARESRADVIVVEVGGTIGDIESQAVLEALRQMRLEEGRHHTAALHLTLIPFIRAAGELKTKPTQHSVKELQAIGIQPDILICRTEREITREMKSKIALYCNVEEGAVIQAIDTPNIYEIPMMFRDQGLDHLLAEVLELPLAVTDISDWEAMVRREEKAEETVEVAVVGKYVTHQDAYKSIREALGHGGIANDVKVKMRWLESDRLDKVQPGYEETREVLESVSGILVPGGFGIRGIEGKVNAARYAREKGVPYFGICLGMQAMVIEFGRNLAGLKQAHSAEFEPEGSCSVIDLMTDQEHVEELGGTMRLGAWPCALAKGTLARKIYGSDLVYERHRHRYEVNNQYREALQKAGMVLSGISPNDKLVEIAELPNHPFMIGVQFHPEFKSQPLSPHPIFAAFIKAAKERQRGKK